MTVPCLDDLAPPAATNCLSMDHLPRQVLAAVVNRPDASILDYQAEPITGSSGAATGAVIRLSGIARYGAEELPFSLVRKDIRPPMARHSVRSHDPRHWSYWRREPLAYASGLLPAGPELAAPRCYVVIGDVVYLADVGEAAEAPRVAARRLGTWQARAATPDVPWLANHRLAERIGPYRLDWRGIDVDPGIVALWNRREELLDSLDRVPPLVTHGDFSAENLLALTPTTTAVLDWATFGIGVAGSDLANLALSAREDLLADYLAGFDGVVTPACAELGYRVTLALIGTSRIHWMHTQGIPLPAGYEDFVLTHAP